MWCDNTDPDTRHDWEGNAPAARSSTREEIWKDSTEELRLTTFSLDDLSAEEESGDKEADEPISALPTEEEVQVKDAPADEARGKEILGDEAVRMRAQSSLSRRSVSMADIGSRNAKNRQMRRVNSRFLLGECGFVIRYEHRFLSSALSRFNDGSSRPLILNSPAFRKAKHTGFPLQYRSVGWCEYRYWANQVVVHGVSMALYLLVFVLFRR